MARPQPTSARPAEGTAEAQWRSCAWLAETPVLALPDAGTRIVVLAAHPDDETLGAGGLIAMAAQRAHPVEVVLATDGEESDPVSWGHSARQPFGMPREETTGALSDLARQVTVTCLGLAAGSLAGQVKVLTAAVRARVDAGPTPCWLLAPWRGDGHPDHEACAAVAEAVAGTRARVWQYPIWAWHWDQPADGALPSDRMCRLPLTGAAAAAKQHAIARYRSQLAPPCAAPGAGAVLPRTVLAHFTRDAEYLIDPVLRPATRAEYFTELYASSDDPWGLAERWYEQRKRAVLLASLPRRRFRRGFEPGCATGLLSVELASRCDELIVADLAERAVEQTKARLGSRGRVCRMRIPDQWPEGTFDLIVLCEVGYYCADLPGLVERVAGSLAPDGVLAACHWRHPAPDHPQVSEDVHAALRAVPGLVTLARHDEADFLLDILSRVPRSVAQLDGVIP